MKSKWLVVIALISAVLLSSCAGMIGPRDVVFPVAKLQQSLDKRLPFSKRYFGLIDVTANHAQLAFSADDGHTSGQNERLLIDLDVTMGFPLLNKSWPGKMLVSGVLGLDTAHNAVVLNDARVEKLALDGMDKAYSGQTAQIGSALVGELLQRVPLYTFKPDDLRFAGVSFLPTKIVTQSDKLVVTFEPQK
ncbi:DUF1439 domain-containing protein [Glaciimonas soli]|uniref:DUF1439 domain-containing protein n=1 Tax=Glaciimonas soli TaxID=2590999 RepID=A0A843YP81_9BURK|nr:DUF1439 domain-containing protein [Glaciimonas soli]MQR01295.1 DUF1439 domain-containing protein [Glaciimonas soli]